MLVDIDAEVIRARTYFLGGVRRPTAVIVGDGLAYVRDAAAAEERFDVVLIDSTDPWTRPSSSSPAFYTDCATLTADLFERLAGVPVREALGGIFARLRYVGQTTTRRAVGLHRRQRHDRPRRPLRRRALQAMEPALRAAASRACVIAHRLHPPRHRGGAGALPSLCPP